MKTLLLIILVTVSIAGQAQSIVGKWQLSEQKTCFDASEAGMTKSETEKELESAMGGSSVTGTARVMSLDEKGNGEDGVMSAGKKKASSKTTFKYQVSGAEFQVVDKRSGVVMQRWIIDEITDTSLKMHDALKDCETKAYLKVK